ncbi:D-alanyl-D-alanine carboxypeptidase family protein [Sulfitobacter delicatus]|uniref:serine-type D-Ala-D-Ala carboxypeptidase n=1 Tax=Sulfitobacter delicatus TaxID=218672 RepID=A0A1G7P6L1_9RHOB|nr:D-alanyl-D-alanine carboxypeptidase family protein [Sulfitobacter delicatus]SDF81908.1 D-alanyl-D-alanine carboxypeptidase (penicillin-binding protein 5/6) [Sulfitobacter delicatus]
MIRLFAAALALVLTLQPAAAFDTRATAAYVLDQTTGTVLLAKNADEPLPPASMSKLMTLYMAFEAVERGKQNGGLDLVEELPVSQHAMSYGGSTMFLDTTDRVSVEDLIRGIIVLSGNDASAVIAEALSPDGTEYGFARLMTQRAQQMGMTNSTFANSNGWPAAGHLMSVRDLGLLANRIITDFPQFYPLFAEREFAFDGRAPQNKTNRNPLLGLGIGADGLKTGHTAEAGYGLVGSAKQGDRRVIFVLSGLDSAATRAQEAESVVNWAFRQFTQRELGKAGTQIAEAPVALGTTQSVGLELKDNLEMLVPVTGGNEVQAEVIYTGPFQAPINKGDELAELVVDRGDLPALRVPLVASASVAPGGFMVKMTAAAMHLMNRLNAGPQAEAPAPEAEAS